MKTFEYHVKNALGIHARPAALIAQACTEFKSAVTLEANGETAGGSNVLQILKLQAVKGTLLKFTVEGPDEETAAAKLQEVLKEIAPKDRKVSVLKVAFFGTKDYDRLFFSELSKDKGEGTYNTDIRYFTSRLTPETAHLANGFDAVCIFVNDEAPREEVVPMNGMRKAIAKNMLNSHMTSPTVTANLSVDMSAMKAYREQLKAKEIKVSYTDLLVKFIAKALTEFPLLNCSVEDNKIVYKHYVNMGVAVALDNGLVVPNVPDADKKSLTEISKEIKELAKLAREGGLPMEKLRGGTFTITNLGMYGIESFTPIINQPEVAILGVTTMEDRAVVRGGEIVIRPMMTLSLTFDHRVVDGSVAAEFLQRVKALLENPALMLA